MRTMHRFAAMATAASLALGSAPAFALGVYGSSDASGNIELNDDVSASSKIKLEASINNRCKNYTGTDAERCRSIVKAQFENRVDAKVNHGQFVKSVRNNLKEGREFTREQFEKTQMRVEKLFERSINALGKVAQKVCKNENSEDAAVRSCLANIKASVSAKFSAMIDAAFRF